MRKIFFLLFVLNFSCSNPESVKEADQEILTLAWYSVPSNETSLLRYMELKETGITHNLTFFPDAEMMAKGLDTAQKAGIKMIVYCPELKTNVSVAHTGSSIPRGTKLLEKLPPEIKTLKTEGTGAVISLLKNSTNSYLAVVNRDFRNPMDLYIECDAKVKRVFKDGTSVPASLYQNNTEIDAGDIAIFMWED